MPGHGRAPVLDRLPRRRIAALLLSSAAVGVGLAMGGRLVKGRGLDLRAAHEALSLATLTALVVHAVALLGDSYLNASVWDIAIPFVSGYKEPWMSIGIVAGWALVALGVSYYFRTRIGVARWKKLHRWTALAWLAGIVHSLGEGTEAGTAWFLVCTAVALAWRASAARSPPPPSPASSRCSRRSTSRWPPGRTRRWGRP
jgi:methionine sulfoxide reductase heme-binding subunit